MKSKFGKKLETLRKANHWTLIQAAAKAGLPRYTWQAIEYGGTATPQIDTVVKIARLFRMTVEELIQDTQYA